MDVHRELGPGLLESSYQACMALEMADRGLRFEREYPVRVRYRGRTLEPGYFIDFLVERQVVVELKSVSEIARIHVAQVLTYLKLTGHNVALLINFNKTSLQAGIRRVVLDFPEDGSACGAGSSGIHRRGRRGR